MFFTDSRFDRLVERMFDNDSFNSFSWNTINRYRNMPIVSRDKNGYEIEIPLPGYEKEDLSVSIEGDTLLISAAESETNHRVKSFERLYTLPEEIDVESCEASMKAGVLTVTFKNMVEEQPIVKKVKIN